MAFCLKQKIKGTETGKNMEAKGRNKDTQAKV